MKVSEQFLSVQGEGVTQGIPAYFIRLQGCNLMCGGKNSELLESGKATWYCDSESVWRNGINKSNQEVIQQMKNDGALEKILTGKAHIVWTGGEPTIPHHQDDINNFLNYFSHNHSRVYNEVETNATYPLKMEFIKNMNQINASPKLANSGMSEERRINPYALTQINRHGNSWFKFVVSNENDISEIEETFIKPYNLVPSKVILMPGVDNRKDYAERLRFSYEMTKKFGYRTIGRSHIEAWDKTTGV